MVNKVFAKNLRLLRTKFNLTQKQLAEKVGVSWEMISRYENAKTMPDWVTFVRIARALHVEPAALLNSELMLSDVQRANVNSMRLPLIVSLKGVQTCSDLRDLVIKTNAYYLSFGSLATVNLDSFVLVIEGENTLLPKMFMSVASYPMYLVFVFLKQVDTIDKDAVYLVVTSGKPVIAKGRNILNTAKICARLERLVVDLA